MFGVLLISEINPRPAEWEDRVAREEIYSVLFFPPEMNTQASTFDKYSHSALMKMYSVLKHVRLP